MKKTSLMMKIEVPYCFPGNRNYCDIKTVTCFSKFGPLILKHFTIGALGLTSLDCQIITWLCLSSASTSKLQQGLVQTACSEAFELR